MIKHLSLNVLFLVCALFYVCFYEFDIFTIINRGSDKLFFTRIH